MLPNWIIIGIPRASTSSLFRWLVDHPQVGGSTEKETYYFVDPGSHMFRPDRNFRDHGLAGYERHFENCDSSASVVIEATPSYIYSECALTELPELPTRPQFIVLIREPVAQLRSLHSYFQQNWGWISVDMSFRDFIASAESRSGTLRHNELAANALANAWYPKHIRRWNAAAGAERVHVILFEELVNDSRAVMRRLSERMAIDPAFYNSYAFPVENPTYVVRSSLLQKVNLRMRAHLPRGATYRLLRSAYRALNTRSPCEYDRDLETERHLSLRYAPMLEELERDLGLDLSAWKRAAERPGPGITRPLLKDAPPPAPRAAEGEAGAVVGLEGP